MREATGVRYLKLYGMKMRTNLQKFYPICFLIRSVIMTTRKAFYHAFVAGLFANAGYIVESNYENGLGRSDLVIKDRKLRRAIVIELKIAKKIRIVWQTNAIKLYNRSKRKNMQLKLNRMVLRK